MKGTRSKSKLMLKNFLINGPDFMIELIYGIYHRHGAYGVEAPRHAGCCPAPPNSQFSDAWWAGAFTPQASAKPCRSGARPSSPLGLLGMSHVSSPST